MEKKPPRAKKSRRRADAQASSIISDKVVIAKSLKTFSEEKDDPIKCASPPCYLSEIGD